MAIDPKSGFERFGAELQAGALRNGEMAQLHGLFDAHKPSGPGKRVFGDPILSVLLQPGSSIHGVASTKLGPEARAVRALLFDKRADANWALGWHQDRTIAVKERLHIDGYGPWSCKNGIHHVEPPIDILESMITLRVHLDPCGPANAPLKIIPGSHLLGRIPVADINEEVAGLGSYTCTAQQGDVWVYATTILHASDAATHPSSRRVLQLDYATRELPGGLQWCGV